MTRTVAVACALLVGALFASAAQAADPAKVDSPWSWKDYGAGMHDVSCASAQSCVAVGARGMVLRSPAPDGQPLAWSAIALQPQKPARTPQEEADNPTQLQAVTCTATSCIAISNLLAEDATAKSWVYRSTDAGQTWTAIEQLDPDDVGSLKSQSAYDVACDPNPPDPAARSCYAVGPSGGVWRSITDGRSWDPVKLSAAAKQGLHRYDHVDCPSSICLAVGGTDTDIDASVLSGNKVTPLDMPTGPDAPRGVASVSCDTVTRCVVVANGRYLTVTLPGGALSKVRGMRDDVLALETVDVACGQPNVCVALDPTDMQDLRTLQLPTPNVNWQRRPMGTDNVEAIDCVGASCVAVGKHATWFASSDSGDNWAPVNEVPTLGVASCQLQFDPICIAGGEKDVSVSHTGGQLWLGPLRGYPSLNVASLNCTGPLTCLILAKNQALFTDDMDVFQPRKPVTYDPKGADAQACVTADLCVALGEAANVTTFDGAKTDWIQNAFPGRGGGIACIAGQTDPVTCYALTRQFVLRGTMTVKGALPTWTWVNTDADPPGPKPEPEGIGCDPSGAQCTVAGKDGLLMTSTSDPMHWRNVNLFTDLKAWPTKPDLKGVSCVRAGVCLVGGGTGITSYVFSTSDNWATYSVDTFAGVQGAELRVLGFACETVNHCLGVGSSAFIGERNPPLPTT
jgi:photosystem II stability/assembly factor-like uncharacterized protein